MQSLVNIYISARSGRTAIQCAMQHLGVVLGQEADPGPDGMVGTSWLLRPMLSETHAWWQTRHPQNILGSQAARMGNPVWTQIDDETRTYIQGADRVEKPGGGRRSHMARIVLAYLIRYNRATGARRCTACLWPFIAEGDGCPRCGSTEHEPRLQWRYRVEDMVPGSCVWPGMLRRFGLPELQNTEFYVQDDRERNASGGPKRAPLTMAAIEAEVATVEDWSGLPAEYSPLMEKFRECIVDLGYTPDALDVKPAAT